MFSSWPPRLIYLLCAALALVITAKLTRPGLEESLERPIVRGFGPPCTLWQAWKVFFSFFWERVLVTGTFVSCTLRATMGSWHLTDLLIALGVIAVFPFQEYLSHRYLLHGPRKTTGVREVMVLVHRVHHRDPWHMERAINPPIAVVLYVVGLPIIFFPLFAPAQAMTGVAVSWLVLLWYEWIHLLIHTSHVPRNFIYKRIWRNHRLHHFKNEHFWYNVSTYGVDSLLHTGPKPESVPTSPSCLTLDDGS